MFGKKISGVVVAAALAAVGGTAQGRSETICEIGFEDPAYFIGSLGGQNGWTIEPPRATAMIGNWTCHSGYQAMKLMDLTTHAYAVQSMYEELSGRALISSYAMYVPASWASLGEPGWTTEAAAPEKDQFEAHMRLELWKTSELVPERWVIEYGFRATGGDPLPEGGLVFVEIMPVVDGACLNPFVHASIGVDYADFTGAWREFELSYHYMTGQISLRVDGVPVLQLEAPASLDYVTEFKLCNERWGTGASDSKALFFDDVSLETRDQPIADFDGDGIVGVADMLFVLGSWGECYPPPLWIEQPLVRQCLADLSGDGTVNVTDLLLLLADWG